MQHEARNKMNLKAKGRVQDARRVQDSPEIMNTTLPKQKIFYEDDFLKREALMTNQKYARYNLPQPYS